MDNQHDPELTPLQIGTTPDANHVVLTGIIAEDPRMIQDWGYEWCASTLAVVGEFLPSPNPVERRQTYIFKFFTWGKAAEELRAKRRGDRVRIIGMLDFVAGTDMLHANRWEVAVRAHLVEDLQDWMVG